MGVNVRAYPPGVETWDAIRARRNVRAYTDEPWLYPLLAYHWSKADDPLRALDYLQKAGEHALGISARSSNRG